MATHRNLLLALGCCLAALSCGEAENPSSPASETVPIEPAPPALDAHAIAAEAENPLCAAEDTIAALQTTDRFDRYVDYVEQDSEFVREDFHGKAFWRTPEGRFWSAYKNDITSLARGLAISEVSLYGSPEAEGVREGDVVVDAGARLGMFTRDALEQGAARVVALEVDTKTLTALKRNVALALSQRKVSALHRALWDEATTVRAGDLRTIEQKYAENDLCSDCIGIDERVPDGREVEVETKTLDALVGELTLDRLDLIRLDVPGSHTHALAGARETLRRFRPRIAIDVEDAADVAAEMQALEAAITEAVPEYRYRCTGARYLEAEKRIVPSVVVFSAPPA